MNKYLLFIAGLVSFTVLGSASACNNDTESAAEVAEEQIISPETPAQNSEEMEEVAIEAIGQKVKISTDLGDIIVLLYDQTPKHRDNFIKLAKEGFYDGLLFHRVMNNFMIQGGDPESKTATPGQMLGGGGPGYTIPAEFVDSLIHKKGALAAARQGDQVNPKKESSGSQYYIVHGRT
ncbi:MAG: peptidylprolyl isomerase, partial [Flavobacteriales bacterium]|nr:peptidylprolyl isomerase [Flavobacteriales bacterium]